MTYDIDNEKLTAYVLGELEEAERKAVEKALESDETLRQRVAELRAAAKLAAEALKSEPAHALTDSQRETIVGRAEETSRRDSEGGASRERKTKQIRRPPRFRWQVAAAAAAVLVLGVVVIILSPALSPRYASEKAPGPVAGVMIPDTMTARRVVTALGIAPETMRERYRQFGGGGGYGGQDVSWRVEPRTVADESLKGLEATQPDRYLIKNASLTIETEDARKASDMLVAALEELGGYVSDFRESVDPLGRRSIHIQVRVPADKFQSTMERLEPLGKVLSRQITTEDVTEQFVDTDARLRNLKRTEERLLAHLDRTGKLEDVVKVEHELTRVREQIEVLEGRLRFLSHRVEFSTINITLQERPKAGPVVPPETYSMAKIASEAARSLVGFFQNLSGCVIWLGIWAVVWVPLLGVVIFLVRRGIRQARKAQE